VLVVEVMSKGDVEDEGEETGAETETDGDVEEGGESSWSEEGENDMDVARVYEGTILQLGEALASKTGYDAGDG